MFLGLWGFALSNNLHNLQVQAAVPDCPSDSLSDQSILMHLFDGLLPIITLDCIRSISNVAAGLYFSVSVFQGPITGLWCVIVPVCLFKLVMLICLHTVHLWRRSRGPVLSSPCIPRLQQLRQSCSQLFPLGFSRGAGWQLGEGGFCRDVCTPGAWRGAGGEGAEAAQPSLVWARWDCEVVFRGFSLWLWHFSNFFSARKAAADVTGAAPPALLPAVGTGPEEGLA